LRAYKSHDSRQTTFHTVANHATKRQD
jgi:hypothetical protein